MNFVGFLGIFWDSFLKVYGIFSELFSPRFELLSRVNLNSCSWDTLECCFGARAWVKYSQLKMTFEEY